MSHSIDWTTLPQSDSGTSQDSSKGYIDIGSVRIQYITAKRSNLSTGSSDFNAWTDTWPAAFANDHYSAICALNSDTGGVSGGEFKVASRTTTQVQVNYNHTGGISNSSVYYSIFAIGMKP